MSGGYLGDFPTGATIYVPFDTFAGSTGASITMTGFAVGDILIYKDGGTTQRSSTAGFTLLDTDGIDFDGITGIQGFKVDLSDNTDAGFYAAAHEYFIVISSVTVDSQTLNFVAGSFSIERSGGALALIKSATFGLSALKTLIDTIDDFVDTEVAAIKAKTDNLPASPANEATLTTIASYIDTEVATIVTATTASAIRTALGLASANLDTQLGTIDDFLDTEVAAIKAKTDNLPASPANEATLTTIAGYIDTEVAAIVTATTASAIRAALGLASANLDTQLTTIDDFLDTEIAAIKAKTDTIPASPAAVGSAMTLASGAVDAASIATAAAQKIAHVVLRRLAANIEAASDGDTVGEASLYGLIQRASKSDTTTHAGKHTIFKSDGTTELAQVTITVDATADPITKVT